MTRGLNVRRWVEVLEVIEFNVSSRVQLVADALAGRTRKGGDGVGISRCDDGDAVIGLDGRGVLVRRAGIGVPAQLAEVDGTISPKSEARGL